MTHEQGKIIELENVENFIKTMSYDLMSSP